MVMVQAEHIGGIRAASSTLTWLRTLILSTATRAFCRLPASTSTRCHSYHFTRRHSSHNSELNSAINGLHMNLLREESEQLNISVKDAVPGMFRCICPKCKGGSKQESSLAVKINADGSAFCYCFRATCGYRERAKYAAPGAFRKSMSGSQTCWVNTQNKATTSSLLEEFTEEALGLLPLSNEVKLYFEKLGISSYTLNRNGVRIVVKGQLSMIAFPYIKDKKIVNCKYLDSRKNSLLESTKQSVFYGFDDIKETDEIIIVKDEIDKLSVEEAGYVNCISLPNADNFKDNDFEYIRTCTEYIDNATRIVLATGSDETGEALSEELARRFGKERCWRVNWPKYTFGKKLEDANEVLLQLGKKILNDMIRTAELYPIRGLFRFCDFYKEIDDYYYLRLGDELGVSTGWHGLDDFYKVVPGELTIITGIPNSGKSEWIDALLCNLNHSKGWNFALCSMENKVREHGRKLLEKHLKKPFFDAPYANSIPRMTEKDFERGKEWLNQTFYLIRCDNDNIPSVQWVLDLAKVAVMRFGIRGLVIDPYNELDHQRRPNQTETEYVSQMLTKVKRFAQHHGCHVWFVAHPRQLQGWNGEAPNLYDISGSAHFVNKCDNGIIIHRNRDPRCGPVDQIQVFVGKVRNKAAGTIGKAYLFYNRVTGTFIDYDDANDGHAA